jgi:hypothetical protein
VAAARIRIPALCSSYPVLLLQPQTSYIYCHILYCPLTGMLVFVFLRCQNKLMSRLLWFSFSAVLLFYGLSLVFRETTDHLSHKSNPGIGPESSCLQRRCIPYRGANSPTILFLRVPYMRALHARRLAS